MEGRVEDDTRDSERTKERALIGSLHDDMVHDGQAWMCTC